MKNISVISTLLIIYVLSAFNVNSQLLKRVTFEGLGYIPTPEAIKFLSIDHSSVVAEGLVLKVLMYFGQLVEVDTGRILVPPDYIAIKNILETSIKLDPYNLDAYYFTQAILVWDMGQYDQAQKILEYGMNYRTWDPILPYFAGFNEAYFLKNPAKAAYYYKRVADITGDSLVVQLTGRYLQESGQTHIAIDYLENILRNERNEAVRSNLKLRIEAFKCVEKLEFALKEYSVEHKSGPEIIEELIGYGGLSDIPKDPYGGSFYVVNGKIKTTSKFAILSK